MWLKIIAVVVAIGVAGMIFMGLLGWAWYTWGALGALLFSFLIIMLIAWLYDRRQTRQYDDLTA